MQTWGRNWHEMVILSGIEAQRQKVGFNTTSSWPPRAPLSQEVCHKHIADPMQTIKAFENQYQQRMLQSWEEEKARILQDELGVTDDEISRLAGTSNGLLGQSGLGKSGLGSSTRRVSCAPVALLRGGCEA